MRYVIDKHGATFIAHRDDEHQGPHASVAAGLECDGDGAFTGHDCLEDESGIRHAQSDHPVAALRALLKQEEG